MTINFGNQINDACFMAFSVQPRAGCAQMLLFLAHNFDTISSEYFWRVQPLMPLK